MRIPLIGPSATPFSLAAGEQQSLNCHLEVLPDGEKNKYVLRGRPGMRLFVNCASLSGLSAATPIRGLWSGGGRLFVAAGTKFFEINSSAVEVSGVRSTIVDDSAHSPVDILPNGNQLFVVSAGTGYYSAPLTLTAITFAALSGQCSTLGTLVLREDTANSSTTHTDSFDVGMIGQTITINAVGYTVSSVTNPNLLVLTSTAGTQSFHDWSSTPVLTAKRGTFLDGYYAINRTGTRQLNISGLNDASAWAALDFALKEGYPDNLAAVWSEPPLLYLLGTETLEIWRNTGNASFPLERVDGGFARVGLAATWSPCSIMGKLHMLAGGTYGQTVAVRMEGATPVRVSTHAVEEAMKAWAFPAQGTSFSYVDRGHWYWVVGLDSGNSWVYDATASAQMGSPQWHERAAWSGSALTQYVPRYHTFIPEWGTGGKHIVGDAASGKLYEMSSEYFDDDTTDIRTVRTLAYVYHENRRIFHHRIEFELETGTTATPPVVKLDWSDDRGRTFGTGSGGAGTTLTLGPGVSGTYTTPYYAAGLGSSRGRVYRISITGQGRVALIDATLEATIGAT